MEHKPIRFQFYPLNLQNQTLKIILRTNMYGEKVKIRLSNKFGNQDIHIGKVTVGLYYFDKDGLVENLQTLTFEGNKSLVLKKGEMVYSDSVDLKLETFDHLAISIYIPEKTTITTVNSTGAKCYIYH